MALHPIIKVIHGTDGNSSMSLGMESLSDPELPPELQEDPLHVAVDNGMVKEVEYSDDLLVSAFSDCSSGA